MEQIEQTDKMITWESCFQPQNGINPRKKNCNYLASYKTKLVSPLPSLLALQQRHQSSLSGPGFFVISFDFDAFYPSYLSLTPHNQPLVSLGSDLGSFSLSTLLWLTSEAQQIWLWCAG